MDKMTPRFMMAVVVAYGVWALLDGRHGLARMDKTLAEGFPALVVGVLVTAMIVQFLSWISGGVMVDRGYPGLIVWAVLWVGLFLVAIPQF